MERIPLNPGTVIKGTRDYIIDGVAGNGATCLVYDAHYEDKHNYRHNVKLKECFPFGETAGRKDSNLIWKDDDAKANSLNAFSDTYGKLMANQRDNTAAGAFDMFQANNTAYIVMDSKEGKTFNECSLSLPEILETVKLLTHVIGKYHKSGYLHLDIKPENFLVYPRPSVHIVLFDFDSVTAIEDIASGKIRCVPYSEDWAAPEQMQGAIRKLCPATDIFSIGAVLFEKITGRRVTNADTGIFAEWEFDKNKLLDGINPKIKRVLTEIFRKTLSANIGRRYKSADELFRALDEAKKTAEERQYVLSDSVISDINFIGRDDDLHNIAHLFETGTKAIFLRGFGGIGKTTLAKKYAELYGHRYDCVKFCRYSNGLNQIIDSLEIANTPACTKDEHRKFLKKALENSKTLIIIDNFDVEDDDDLTYLLNLNCCILFTTRNDFSQYMSAEKISIFELDFMSSDELLQIFKNEYEHDITELEEFIVKEIIQKFGNTTLLVPIIAKQIISSHISIEEFANSIKDDIFARFDEDNEDIRIRKDGKSVKTNSLNYLRAMFNVSALPDEHKTALRYLFLLRYYDKENLSVSDYRKYTSSKNLNTLNDLAFRNWITIEKGDSSVDDEITVHQLIYDLIEKDFYPTYESVPGLSSYIESCFDVLDEILKAEREPDESDIDWEAAECITFALLMYDDIQKSENREAYTYKMSRLFSFMSMAFHTDPQKTYELFFMSPKESTYRFHISGIMNHIDLASNYFERITYLREWDNVSESDRLTFTFPNGHSISFQNHNAKKAFAESMSNELNELYDTLSKHSIMQILYFTMCSYFYAADGQKVISQEYIRHLDFIETLLSTGDSNILPDNISEDDFMILRLFCYLPISPTPRYDRLANLKTTDMNLTMSDYEFQRLTFNLLKQALQLNLDTDLKTKYLKKAEELIILLEAANDRFAWYGQDEKSIQNYVPDSYADFTENKKAHWSKKADKWYSSVKDALQGNDPYPVYKLLLTRDYHFVELNNSKINKLLSSDFINQIYEDSRISDEQRYDLMFDHVVKQVNSIKFRKKKLSVFTKKHLPTLRMYSECLSKARHMLQDFDERILNEKTLSFIDSAFILKKCLKSEIFDINSYVDELICLKNAEFIGELVYFSDKVRSSGYIKKSQELKHKILDLCLDLNFSDLSEKAIQMILYKIRPLAANYNRKDVLSKIDEIEITLERKYFLSLISISSNALKDREQSYISRKFLDDFIEAVATEAYNKMHTEKTTDFVDKMEKLFLKYDYDLISQATLTSFWYSHIFSGRKQGEASHPGHIRQISPFRLSEFTYGTYNRIVDIGVCYMIAESYDYIQDKSIFNCPLEAVLYHDGSASDYQLTEEETQEFLNNIIKICPKAKPDIDSYLENGIIQ